MSRPPRRPNDRVIDGRMWVGVVAIGAAMAALTLLTIDLYLPGGLIEGSRSLDSARTAGFTVLEHYYRPPGLPREQQPWLATVARKTDEP